MKAYLPFTGLFLIFIVLGILLYFIPLLFNVGIPFNQSVAILTGSFLISAIVMILFKRGHYLGGKSSLTHTFAAISIKFLLYFILIIAIYFLSKNRSLQFILTFFVIYLSFTSYLMFSFVRLLKTKKFEK